MKYKEHDALMTKEGYREVRPGIYTKANPKKTEFKSADEALAHHEATGSDAADKMIAGMVSGPQQ